MCNVSPHHRCVCSVAIADGSDAYLDGAGVDAGVVFCEVGVDAEFVAAGKRGLCGVEGDGAGGCVVVDDLGDVGGRVLREEMVDVILCVDADVDMPVVACRHRPVVVPVGVVGTLHAVVAGDAMAGGRDVYVDGCGIDAGAVFREVRIDAEFGFCVEVGGGAVETDDAGWWGVVDGFRGGEVGTGDRVGGVVRGFDGDIGRAVACAGDIPSVGIVGKVSFGHGDVKDWCAGGVDGDGDGVWVDAGAVFCEVGVDGYAVVVGEVWVGGIEADS